MPFDFIIDNEGTYTYDYHQATGAFTRNVNNPKVKIAVIEEIERQPLQWKGKLGAELGTLVWCEVKNEYKLFFITNNDTLKTYDGSNWQDVAAPDSKPYKSAYNGFFRKQNKKSIEFDDIKNDSPKKQRLSAGTTFDFLGKLFKTPGSEEEQSLLRIEKEEALKREQEQLEMQPTRAAKEQAIKNIIGQLEVYLQDLSTAQDAYLKEEKKKNVYQPAAIEQHRQLLNDHSKKLNSLNQMFFPLSIQLQNLLKTLNEHTQFHNQYANLLRRYEEALILPLQQDLQRLERLVQRVQNVPAELASSTTLQEHEKIKLVLLQDIKEAAELRRGFGRHILDVQGMPSEILERLEQRREQIKNQFSEKSNHYEMAVNAVQVVIDSRRAERHFVYREHPASATSAPSGVNLLSIVQEKGWSFHGYRDAEGRQRLEVFRDGTRQPLPDEDLQSNYLARWELTNNEARTHAKHYILWHNVGSSGELIRVIPPVPIAPGAPPPTQAPKYTFEVCGADGRWAPVPDKATDFYTYLFGSAYPEMLYGGYVGLIEALESHDQQHHHEVQTEVKNLFAYFEQHFSNMPEYSHSLKDDLNRVWHSAFATENNKLLLERLKNLHEKTLSELKEKVRNDLASAMQLQSVLGVLVKKIGPQATEQALQTRIQQRDLNEHANAPQKDTRVQELLKLRDECIARLKVLNERIKKDRENLAHIALMEVELNNRIELIMRPGSVTKELLEKPQSILLKGVDIASIPEAERYKVKLNPGESRYSVVKNEELAELIKKFYPSYRQAASAHNPALVANTKIEELKNDKAILHISGNGIMYSETSQGIRTEVPVPQLLSADQINEMAAKMVSSYLKNQKEVPHLRGEGDEGWEPLLKRMWIEIYARSGIEPINDSMLIVNSKTKPHMIKEALLLRQTLLDTKQLVEGEVGALARVESAYRSPRPGAR